MTETKVTLLIAALGGVFALLQWMRSMRISRALFLKDLLTDCEKIGSDDFINRRLRNGDRLSREDANVARVFDFFNRMCFMYFAGNITDSELAILKDRMDCFLGAKSVIDVLDDICEDRIALSSHYVYIRLMGCKQRISAKPYDSSRIAISLRLRIFMMRHFHIGV